MCGIVALWLKNKPVNPDALKMAIQHLNHRGPDEKNIWLSSNQHLGLGHARLSIIGINNGMQPLFSREHGIYAIVNGEFYDYKEIRQKYEKNGYYFLTQSDSEIIIPLYLEYGQELFNHLNGEFSFVIWDEKNKILLAARDRFGIKPLYYYYENENFYAASEIKAMIPFGLKIEWDEYAVELILNGVPAQHLSCFKHIKQIKPGHYIKISNNKLIEEKYWDFNYKNNNEKIDDRDYIYLFKTKLTSAIQKRLVADVPVGFYLSGGIDSSAILALSSIMRSDLKAFNISFDDSVYDEAVFAREMATHMGVDFSSVKVTQQDMADNYHRAIFHRESLIFQTNGIAKYLLSRHVNLSGYKVVLTGEGADELLAGYPAFKEDLLNSLAPEQKEDLDKEIAQYGPSFIVNGDYDIGDLKQIKNDIGYLPSLWKLSFDIGKTIQAIYSDYFNQNKRINNLMKECILNIHYSNLQNVHPVNKSSYIFCKTFFPELVLSYLGDRVEMAHSIEGRLPFLDVDLVEFCNQLPIHLKINRFREKFILYEAVKDLIPQSIYNRGKQAITAPSAIQHTNANHKTPMESLMYDIVHSNSFKDVPFFDQSKTIQLLDSIKKMSSFHKKIPECALNFVLSTYFIQQIFINKR